MSDRRIAGAAALPQDAAGPLYLWRAVADLLDIPSLGRLASTCRELRDVANGSATYGVSLSDRSVDPRQAKIMCRNLVDLRHHRRTIRRIVREAAIVRIVLDTLQIYILRSAPVVLPFASAVLLWLRVVGVTPTLPWVGVLVPTASLVAVPAISLSCKSMAQRLHLRFVSRVEDARPEVSDAAIEGVFNEANWGLHGDARLDLPAACAYDWDGIFDSLNWGRFGRLYYARSRRMRAAFTPALVFGTQVLWGAAIVLIPMGLESLDIGAPRRALAALDSLGYPLVQLVAWAGGLLLAAKGFIPRYVQVAGHACVALVCLNNAIAPRFLPVMGRRAMLPLSVVLVALECVEALALYLRSGSEQAHDAPPTLESLPAATTPPAPLLFALVEAAANAAALPFGIPWLPRIALSQSALVTIGGAIFATAVPDVFRSRRTRGLFWRVYAAAVAFPVVLHAVWAALTAVFLFHSPGPATLLFGIDALLACVADSLLAALCSPALWPLLVLTWVAIPIGAWAGVNSGEDRVLFSVVSSAAGAALPVATAAAAALPHSLAQAAAGLRAAVLLVAPLAVLLAAGAGMRIDAMRQGSWAASSRSYRAFLVAGVAAMALAALCVVISLLYPHALATQQGVVAVSSVALFGGATATVILVSTGSVLDSARVAPGWAAIKEWARRRFGRICPSPRGPGGVVVLG